MRPEECVRAIAKDQLELVTRRQASACGFSDRQLGAAVRKGRFVRLLTGVYLTTGGEPSFPQSALAACLVAGHSAVASHWTASTLWGFTDHIEALHVCVNGHSSQTKGVVVHRTQLLGNADRTRRLGVPVTRVERTLLDLAGVVSRDRLEDILDEALRNGLTIPERVLAYASRPEFANRKGVAALRELCTERLGGHFHGSDMEKDTLKVLRSHKLPEPIKQHGIRARGRTVHFDLAYPDERVAIEFDGKMPHWGKGRWESDMHRGNATVLEGWHVLHFSYWDVKHRPLYVVLIVADALRLRPTGWRRTRASTFGGQRA